MKLSDLPRNGLTYGASELRMCLLTRCTEYSHLRTAHRVSRILSGANMPKMTCGILGSCSRAGNSTVSVHNQAIPVPIAACLHHMYSEKGGPTCLLTTTPGFQSVRVKKSKQGGMCARLHELAGDAFELCLCEVFRVAAHSALGASKGNVHHRCLPRRQASQAANNDPFSGYWNT